jgi:dipeptidyl peptidase-like protein
VALAGQVIASHYAEPVDRVIAAPTALLTAPSDAANSIRQLEPGEPFALLDDSVGWAWGYAGKERRVGYVRTDALA